MSLRGFLEGWDLSWSWRGGVGRVCNVFLGVGVFGFYAVGRCWGGGVRVRYVVVWVCSSGLSWIGLYFRLMCPCFPPLRSCTREYSPRALTLLGC